MGRIVESNAVIWCIVLAFFIILFAASCGVVHADSIDVDKLADSIYLAEGGAHTRHPYGILAHYKHTTPRQACINTIKTGLRKWNGQGCFIEFLGRTYCPVGASNDPNGLNRFWVANVRYHYNNLTN